jgi:hypothetical protein
LALGLAMAIGTPTRAANVTLDWISIKDPVCGPATGNGSTDDTSAIQACIDYAFNNGYTGVYCPAGTYKTSSTLYLDPPGNLRSSLASPTMFGFSMAFFGDAAAAGNHQGCQIRSTFNNGIAFLVGTGQGMRVSDIEVTGPSNGYRGQQSNAGVGIGLAGGSGGSSINLVENTYVNNFYALYKTDANAACCLSDSNTFRKIAGNNGYYGILVAGSQAYINDVVEPSLTATIGIDSELSRQVTVFGGNISATSGQSASFGLSSVSSFTKVADGNGFDYTFTGTIASPDQYVNTVYNSYTVITSHFGVIPLTMTAWNSGTNVGTFQIWIPWAFANYGINDLTSTTDMQAEVAAATTLYATERVVVAQGMGITLDGVHVENPVACSSLLMAQAAGSGAMTNEIRNPYFNYDPSLPGAALPILYCQRSFPFIGQEAGGIGNIRLRGGYYGASLPINVETQPFREIDGSALSGFQLNTRVYDSGGYAYSQLGGNGQFQTEARGIGTWDTDYFIPGAWITASGAVGNVNVSRGELTSPYCGFEPCPWTTPNLSPTLYAEVSGALGAIGSYPPIACRTVFKSVDWNTTALTHLYLRSASCPGYSWGQNLTDSVIGETVTWSYKGQSDALYLDAKTLSWMFPGLGISVNNGGGAVSYIVTGVYPDLGYITVINATSNGGALLSGTKTTVYSCASSCSIGQAAYSWTAY